VSTHCRRRAGRRRCFNNHADKLSRCDDRWRPVVEVVEQAVWNAVLDVFADPDRLVALAGGYLGLQAQRAEAEQEQLATVKRRSTGWSARCRRPWCRWRSVGSTRR
jgi:hypothetical protein